LKGKPAQPGLLLKGPRRTRRAAKAGSLAHNATTTPTAVTLSGLSATSPLAALVVMLLATTGLVVLRKRK